MPEPPFIIDRSPATPELLKIAEEELRETPEIVAQGLKELREILANDPTITYETDDEFLQIFLRPCKYYAQSAYELMKRIADYRAKYKDTFHNLLPEDEKEAFTNHNVVNVLTNRDHKGRRVLLVNLGGTWNTSKVKPDQLLRILYLIHLAAMLEADTQIRGAVVIMDYKGLGLKQVAAFTPSFAIKLMTFIQDALPLRLKEVHFVNNPTMFNLVWKVIKPLIKEKLSKRIHFHESKMESLHNFLPPTHLPEDYGGDLPAINYSGKDWYPAVEEYVEHIKKWNSCGRVSKSK